MKKRNLGVCFGIIITCICLFFETGYAATYYVSNSGKDNKPGQKEQTAWQTIGKVNSFVFSKGDTVLFKRGDTFSDTTLEIKNVENFTIGDYGEGEKPLFDGNQIKPILITDSKNVTIKNINISGQEWHPDKSSNIEAENVEGLLIDGVYGNGHTINRGNSKGKTAFSIQNGSGLIEIKNCELFNWGPYDLPKPGTEDFMGIALMNMEIGEYKIHGNKIYNINSDGIHLSLTKANGAVFNNILYNAGADAIGIKGSENCEIYENEFYRTAEFLGEGGSGSEGLPAYINLHQVGELFSKNNTISANSFKDGDGVAIKLGSAQDTKINENIFSNVKSALYIQDLVKNTMFHHNIIENPQSRIIASENIDAGCIYENNSAKGTQIYNNTIYNGKGNSKHLIALANSNKTTISNNIVYQNDSSEDAFGLYYNTGYTDPVINDNYWYNPAKLNRTKYSNKTYTADMQEDWNQKNPGDKFDNPLMNDPEEGDYSLYEKDLKLGAVYDETDDSVAETDDSTVVTDDSVAETDDSTVVTDEVKNNNESVLAAQEFFQAKDIYSFPEVTVDPSSENVFSTPIAWFNGALYTVDIEPPEGEKNGINLKTVVRKGVVDDKGNWTWVSNVVEDRTLEDKYHTQASIAVDKKGYIHVVYNMHNMPWQYKVSKNPEDISDFEFLGEPISTETLWIVKHENKTSFPNIGTSSIPGTQVTYPAFFKDRNEDLYVTYRFATRPARDWLNRGFAGGIAKYNVDEKVWEPIGGKLAITEEDAIFPDPTTFPQYVYPFAYEDKWSVYLLRLHFDINNRMHVSWTWREGGAGGDCSDPSYAFSDISNTEYMFQKSNGEKYTLPISVIDSDKVNKNSDISGFYSPTSISTDRSAAPYILLNPIGHPRFIVQADKWSESETSPWGATQFFIDENDRQWAFATGPTVLYRDKNDSKWELAFSEEERGYGFQKIIYVKELDGFFVHTLKTLNRDKSKVYWISKKIVY